MIQTLFSIDAFVTQVKNWKIKKKKLNKHIKQLRFNRRLLTDFETTRYDESNLKLTDILLNIFKDEFNAFGIECGFKNINITDSWVVRYKQHDHQIAHHHGKVMYSGILYLDLHEDQESTTFVAPWPNEINSETKLARPECKEGTLIIFPGHLLHFVKPNLLKKDRNIISFDMNCDVEGINNR